MRQIQVPSIHCHWQIGRKKCGYCKCDGIMIDKENIGEAAIDYHTLNDYYSISDFVSIMHINYITFVFNKNVGLKTDCD